jgi:hypothetical protein
MPLDDVPQLEEIEGILDDLESPTSLDVYAALLPYEGTQTAAVATKKALDASAGGATPTLADVLTEGNSPGGTG